jgi:D-glycero-D-manno-heptose 1,7-bisphosphate phosphatase
MTSAPRRPAVFLDRDGTLNREIEGALARVDQLELLPGALAGAARLRAAGFVLVVVSNQSAVARGWAGVSEVVAVNHVLAERMAAAGAAPAGLYVCPHHPTEGAPPYRRACPCRKPGSGLLERAARDLGLDLSASWVIGDAERDLVAGEGLGVRGVLVLSGKGRAELERLRRAGRPPPRVAEDLQAAAEQVLAQGAA